MRNRADICIIDYDVGNVASLINMFDQIDLGARLVTDPPIVARSRAIVLPGVGSFAHAMAKLRERGLDDAIREAASNGAALLGVCLGMQLLARRSEEGGVAGLGLIDADVIRIRPSHEGIKVPHMGWCEVLPARDTWLVRSDNPPDRFYFAHSYHMLCDDPIDVAAVIDYDGSKVVAIERGTICGVQFHPEKSHRFGMRLLKDFGARAA